MWHQAGECVIRWKKTRQPQLYGETEVRRQDKFKKQHITGPPCQKILQNTYAIFRAVMSKFCEKRLCSIFTNGNHFKTNQKSKQKVEHIIPSSNHTKFDWNQFSSSRVEHFLRIENVDNDDGRQVIEIAHITFWH